MSGQVERAFVTIDIVIPRLSPSGSGWEVVLIQRNKEPYKDLWALPGGHLTTDDVSLEAAAQREVREETGLDIPLHLFQQVQTYEDFEDPRGKYVCLLYMLSEGMQEIDICQCEVEEDLDQRCPNTAYWRYHGMAVCPTHIHAVVKAQGVPLLKRTAERTSG